MKGSKNIHAQPIDTDISVVMARGKEGKGRGNMWARSGRGVRNICNSANNKNKVKKFFQLCSMFKIFHNKTIFKIKNMYIVMLVSFQDN